MPPNFFRPYFYQKNTKKILLGVIVTTSILTAIANTQPSPTTQAKNQTKVDNKVAQVSQHNLTQNTLSQKTRQPQPLKKGIQTVTALAHNSTPTFVGLQHLPYANPNAPKGGTLSLSAQGTFNSLNPWYDNGTPVTGTSYLYDTLMTGSLSEAFVMYPQLAQKVTFDPDDKSWVIYHVNPHAKFWDGSPVTAHDVKASINAILTKGTMSMRSYLAGIKDIQVIDNYQVKFIFDGADNAELLLTVGQMPIWKKQSIDENFDKVSLTPLVGSGAYKVGHIDAGRSISYVRDPNYWGTKSESAVMANVGRFNFDTIKFVYYQSPEVAFEGFKAGEYQFRAENKARTWVTGYHFPAVKNGMVKKESIENHNPIPTQALVMNNRRALFSDIRVRQALTLAYDFAWLNRTMFYGQYQRLTSFFYGSELQATGTPTSSEIQVLQPLLAKLDPIAQHFVMLDWQSEQSPFYQQQSDGFNRERLLQARALLLQAGFFYQNGKLYQKNGELASFQILINNDSQARIILPYVRNLQRLGFSVAIRNADLPQYLQRVREFDYDMIVDVFSQSLSPGAEQSYLWGSKSADEQGNQNTAGIKNPVIDSVIEQLIKSHNRDDIMLYTKVLDRLLLAHFYVIPTYGKSQDTVAYWQQFEHGALPNNAVGIDYWWVNADKEQAVKAYLGK